VLILTPPSPRPTRSISKPFHADPERAFGRESRSLKAIYELVDDGWNINNIRHVEGGFQQWRYQVLGASLCPSSMFLSAL
jgi:hypothetical protein